MECWVTCSSHSLSFFSKICGFFAPLVLFTASASLPSSPLLSTGVAAIDITPDFPVRLSGYASRKNEVADVAGKIWVKALAIGDTDPAVLLTVDNCAVPASIVEAVHAKLGSRVKRERFAVCSSHTHSAPALRGSIPNIFGGPIPYDHWAHIDRYTELLKAKMVEAAELALKERQPSKLSFAQGSVGFAKNRRRVGNQTSDGPVDHDLPVLKVETPGGNLRAVWASYACHCTTLGGNFNSIHGDWAGEAQKVIQERHPGSIALISIGCGADANPYPRDSGLVNVEQHANALADELDRLVKLTWKPISVAPDCRLIRLDLPLDGVLTKDQLDHKASSKNAAEAHHAQMQLAELARGQAQRKVVPGYPVQCWSFGNDLAIVFLGGEVVVDYSIRLKNNFDRSRLWINAYANDVPCYIASKRVLTEGGYEADSSMRYYAQPGRLAPSVEDQIIAAIEKIVPSTYRRK